MLYEDTSVDVNSDKRFHVELHFSPGAYADFDIPKIRVNDGFLNNNSNLSTPCSSTPSSTDQSEPSSFLDEEHQIKLQTIIRKLSLNDYDKHYITFHGSFGKLLIIL